MGEQEHLGGKAALRYEPHSMDPSAPAPPRPAPPAAGAPAPGDAAPGGGGGGGEVIDGLEDRPDQG